MVREDIPDEKTLVGYVVLVNGADADRQIPQLRQLLKSKLPDYMVPSLLINLDLMPLTPNGKVDRQALPKPDGTRQLTNEYVPARNEIEHQIADIWAQVMNLDRVGIYDNFFELGGYSLLAIQVIARLRQTLQIEIDLSSLFELPTVADLANRVENLRWAAQGRQMTQSDLTEYEEGEL